MAKMTLDELDDRLRGLIAEPSTDRFPLQDSATLGIGTYTLLSDGQRAFCAETGWTKSTASIAVTGNATVSDSTRIYSLPTDLLAIDTSDVTFKNVRIFPLTKKELHILDMEYDETNTTIDKWLTVAGLPEYFYMEKEDVIGLYPAPDADENGETLKLTYYEEPSALTTSTDSSAILWDLAWGSIYWAAAKVFENDGNPQAADRYEMKYERMVQKAMRRKDRYLRRNPYTVMANRQYTVNKSHWIEPQDIVPGRRTS